MKTTDYKIVKYLFTTKQDKGGYKVYFIFNFEHIDYLTYIELLSAPIDIKKTLYDDHHKYRYYILKNGMYDSIFGSDRNIDIRNGSLLIGNDNFIATKNVIYDSDSNTFKINMDGVSNPEYEIIEPNFEPMFSFYIRDVKYYVKRVIDGTIIDINKINTSNYKA